MSWCTFAFMYTDRFFRFPIKIYDGFSARQAERREELTNEPAEADWFESSAVLPAGEFTSDRVYWYESFAIGENPQVDGFTTTTVYSEKFGSFTCLWKKEKFEQELNKFMEARETRLEND